MKRRSLFVFALVAALPLAASAQNAPTIVTPDQVHWTAGSGPLAGVQMAVIAGDPTKSGPFVIRLRIPDGGRVPAHYHGDTERVTVLSGTFLVGVGDRFSESGLKALPAGSFVSIPAGVHHFGMARGETIVQVGGTGPFALNLVDTK